MQGKVRAYDSHRTLEAHVDRDDVRTRVPFSHDMEPSRAGWGVDWRVCHSATISMKVSLAI